MTAFEGSPLATRWRSELDASLAALPEQIRTGAIDTPALFRFMHDLTSLAPTFGYPLAGKVASRVVERLRGVQGPLTDGQRAVALAGCAALSFVMRKEMKGDGGAAGQAILAKLDEIAGD